MEKSILNDWVDPKKEPLTQILSIMPDVLDLSVVELCNRAEVLKSSMVKFWGVFESIYSQYESEMIDEPSVGFKTNIEALNHIMVSQFRELVEMLNSLGLDADFLRLGLEKVLGESNLMSIYDPNNVVQSFIQWGHHLILFKEMVTTRMSTEMEVEYGEDDPWKNRMAGRKIGKVLKELAYKTSNEVFVHTQKFSMVCKDVLELEAKRVGELEEYSNKIKSTLFNMYSSWALHWALLSADSLYIYEKTYQLLIHDNSIEV